MKCPNCGETLKDSSKICFQCGEDISDHEIDHMIDELIREDSESIENEKDINKKGKKERKQKDAKEEVYIGISIRITAYVNVLIILLLVISLWLPWFGFSGQAAYLGFVQSSNNNIYLSQDGLTYVEKDFSEEGEIDLPMLYEFSAKELSDFAKANYSAYETVTTSGGEQKVSWVVKIQSYYIQGIFVLTILAAFGALLLILDRKLKLTEWVRSFSALSALIIMFNYLAVKIPFFSMFANKAQSVLREENPLVAVNMSLKGVKLNQQFFAYEVIEKQGFFMAVICCAVWFVASTILIEIKKDKEFH
ncbi:MAG: zinc-ribbon domain-containing protein [Vallitaleaceae bacterium]|nr:zinc-ribbon domain-containing protein [Vallitaleaceae bacterium]